MSNVIMAFVSVVNGVLDGGPDSPAVSRVPRRRRLRLGEPGKSLAIRSIVAAGILTGAALLRRRYFRWGATEAELAMVLPGDDLLPRADVSATRAITIATPAEEVWPWIAQLGQGRGGFYAYDFLENLVGCDIHSADRIHPEWQQVAVGSDVKLAPEIPFPVAVVQAHRAMVLHGAVPMGSIPTPYDSTWAFVVRPALNGTTRLIVRERYGYTRRWAPIVVQPAELVSCLMSPRMLRGIKKRAEKSCRHAPSPTARSHLQPGSWPDLDTTGIKGALR